MTTTVDTTYRAVLRDESVGSATYLPKRDTAVEAFKDAEVWVRRWQVDFPNSVITVEQTDVVTHTRVIEAPQVDDKWVAMLDGLDNPAYPHGQCPACGHGLTEKFGACMNEECSNFTYILRGE